jgi:hypothetical protein
MHVVVRCACDGLEVTAQKEAFRFTRCCHCSQCRREKSAPYWHGVGYFTKYSVGTDGKATYDPKGKVGVEVTKGKDTHLVERTLIKNKRGYCKECGCCLYHAKTRKDSEEMEDFRIPGSLIDVDMHDSANRPMAGASHIFTESCVLRGLPMDGSIQFNRSPGHPPDYSDRPGSHPYADGTLSLGDEKNRTTGIKDMSLFCSCRKVQLDVKKDGFLFAAYCHCTQCRRMTGCPYWHGAGYKVDSVKILKGKELLKPFKLSVDDRFFCTNCCTFMYHEATDGKGNVTDWRLSVSLCESRDGQAVSWKGGTGDGKFFPGNPGNIRPDAMFHINTDNAIVIGGLPDDGLPQFKGMPGASDSGCYPVTHKTAFIAH